MLEPLRRALRLHDEVLGINARNLRYIYRLNRRGLFPRADDKLIGKEILTAGGIPTPQTLFVFRSHADLDGLDALVAGLDGFAVKPARGAGGRGILIVRRDGARRLALPGEPGDGALDIEALAAHIRYILSGVYSLERLDDRAFLEELLEPGPILGGLACGGVPDLRVLVHRGRPIMAMARIPTARSGGRANLHQGALGLGIDMATGRTTRGILGRRLVTEHPDSGRPLAGIAIPSWPEVLAISVRAAGLAGLGYLGVDVVLDRHRGPLVMELNARPGLNIQIANMRGLSGELRRENGP